MLNRSRKLILLTLLLTSILIPLKSQATFTSGILVHEEFASYLLTPEGRLEILPTHAALNTALSRLNSGDFLVGIGLTERNKFHLQSIHRVGLEALLGLWSDTSDPLRVYSFETFDQVGIQNDTFFQNRLGFTARVFSYMITPGFGDSWTIYLYDPNSNFLGSMVLQTNLLKMNFLDTETGEIAHRVRLRKIGQ